MKRFELFLNVVQVPLDAVLLIAAAVSAYALRFTPFFVAWRPVLFGVTLSDYVRLSTVVAVAWVALFAIAGLYSTDVNRRFIPDLIKVFFACSAGLAGVALYVLFTQQVFDSRFLAAASWFFAVIYVSIGRLFMRGIRVFFYHIGIGNRRVAVIGDTHTAETLRGIFAKRKSLGATVVGIFASFASGKEALSSLGVDEIVYANPSRDPADAVRAVEWCIEHQAAFKYSADLFSTYATHLGVQAVAGVPIVEIRRTRLEGWWRVVKRAGDIAGASAIAIFVSPIMLIAAVAILCETGRPVFYRNERVGFLGKKFFALKFRSMYQKDCTGPQFGTSGEAALQKEQALIHAQSIKSGPIYKIANDPRVTPVGRFLRRWSIDELPQCFNVLAGDMSMVGPRPHQPREVAKYAVPHKRVLFVKPGMTGLAQISGRSDLSFEEEVALDVFYLEHWSWWLDAVICLKTPWAIVRKRQAL